MDFKKLMAKRGLYLEQSGKLMNVNILDFNSMKPSVSIEELRCRALSTVRPQILRLESNLNEYFIGTLKLHPEYNVFVFDERVSEEGWPTLEEAEAAFESENYHSL